ncbi:LytTR family DNA-binding domain-containing protein [Verrucomicrobiaceae bacterium 227]
MRTLIIEDNEIETENLKILLGEFDPPRLIGAVDTIRQGIEVANRERPELILLDIQLECQNSLEHIHQLQYDPYIICCTLHTEHALQAFEVGVNDYLTKPITLEKLSRALTRIPDLTATGENDLEKQCIALDRGPHVNMVPLTQIIQICADGDYTVVRDLHDSEFLGRRRMSEWTKLLPSSLFISLDRSTIINRQRVASFTQLQPDRTAKITFDNGHTHTIGAAALRRLKSALQ